MFVARDDLRHDDAVERAGNFLHAFDFEAEHGEPLGQFLGRPVEINVLFEPVKGDFHVETNFFLRGLLMRYATGFSRRAKASSSTAGAWIHSKSVVENKFSFSSRIRRAAIRQ